MIVVQVATAAVTLAMSILGNSKLNKRVVMLSKEISLICSFLFLSMGLATLATAGESSKEELKDGPFAESAIGCSIALPPGKIEKYEDGMWSYISQNGSGAGAMYLPHPMSEMDEDFKKVKTGNLGIYQISHYSYLGGPFFTVIAYKKQELRFSGFNEIDLEKSLEKCFNYKKINWEPSKP